MPSLANQREDIPPRLDEWRSANGFQRGRSANSKCSQRTGLGCLPECSLENRRREDSVCLLLAIMKMFPTHSSYPHGQGNSLANANLDINSVVQSIQKELSVGSYSGHHQTVSFFNKSYFESSYCNCHVLNGDRWLPIYPYCGVLSLLWPLR